MKASWLHLFAIVSGVLSPALTAAAEREAVALVVDAPLAPAAARALADLERALQARQFKVARQPTLPEGGPAVVVGTAGSATADRLLAAHRIGLPEAPESLCIQRLRTGTRNVLLIAGRDARGLSY